MIEKHEKLSQKLLIIFFFIFVFLFFHKPLTDPDMPWHLKTGEYIFEHKTIPSTDPFSYARDEIPFIGHFILTQYWLAQLFLHLVYKTSGTYGLIFTGAAVFTAIFGLLFYLIRRIGIYLSLLFLSGLGLLILWDFVALRPQILTFLFTATTLFFIERFTEKGDLRLLAPLPLLMLVWANMHGGFIFGIMLLLIYLFSFTLGTAINARHPGLFPVQVSRNQLSAFALATLLSCAVSLLNPNTYHAFDYAFVGHSNKLFSFIREYQTPFAYLKLDPSRMIYAFFSFLPAVVVLVLYFIKNRVIVPALLLLLTLSLTFVGIRYIALFAIVSISVLRYVPMTLDGKLLPRTRTLINLCLILLFGLSSGFMANKVRDPRFSVLETNLDFPVGATAFLLENNIRGNIFSSYDKSSYLLFKLFPGSRLYADSRYISEHRIGTMLAIVGANDTEKDWTESMNKLLPPNTGSIRTSTSTPGKREMTIPLPDSAWDTLLNDINAEIIVHEALDGSGLVLPFIWKLMVKDDWKLVYLDGSLLVFVRDSDKYREIISKFNRPKTLVYDEIIMESLPYLGKKNPHYAVNVALAQLLKGQTDDNTKRLIEIALQSDPNNFYAHYAAALHALLTSPRHSAD